MQTFKITSAQGTFEVKANNKTEVLEQLKGLSFLIEEVSNINNTETKQKIWIDSDAAYDLGVTVASGNRDSISSGGSWFTRKVTNITLNDYDDKIGDIKINGKVVSVNYSGYDNEWRV